MPPLVYRNIYVRGFRKFPYQLLSGKGILCYTGRIICGVDSIPDGFTKDDLYISCDCDFKKWRELKKVFKKK
jgi:hypothetical protein